MKSYLICLAFLCFLAAVNCQNTTLTEQPDVLLNVPNLSVESITLEVDNLQLGLQLNASVASLVKLNAGVTASIEKVNLTISEVEASLLLIVRLDNVRQIIGEAVQMVQNNTGLLAVLLQDVGNAVGGIVGNVTDVVNNVSGDL